MRPMCWSIRQMEKNEVETVGYFTVWISLSLRLSLSPKFGLRPKISQKVKTFFFRLVSAISVDFYLYPTVITALIHLIKHELIRWDWIEYDVCSNWVVTWCVVTIRRIVTYKIFINKQLQHIWTDNKAGTVYSTIQFKLGSSHAIYAGDAWIGKLAMFISWRCDLFRWSVVFWRCRHRRRLPLVHRLPPWRRSLTWTRHDFSYDLQPPSTGKVFVWSPAFLTEPGSARYSSAPSVITVWSNCHTACNDFFEVYISNTVTLSPNVRSNGAFTSLTFSVSITWPIILCSHWSTAFSWSIQLR